MERRAFGVLALIASLVSFPAITARAASMTEVTRSAWAGNVSLPSYVKMYIYVPDKLADKPPIVVSSHSCGSTASGQIGNTPKVKAAADKNGFILIFPDNPGQNCWDVGTTKSLTHDGGGDTHAIAQMVRYALTKYNGDASRVYAMGGSSGAMMTQALMAVYPDLFIAGHARAGVPAGCWADGYASSNQWSGNCAGGNTNKTAQQWGDLVRGMYSGYTGHRPRVQLIQGDADATISFKNMGEAIEEWTNVLSLSTTPTSTETVKTSVATYDRKSWKNACGYTVLDSWAGKGGGHSMAYEEDAILQFFGLETAGGPDPETAACSPDAGVPATGGVVATGGSLATGGTSANGGAGGGRDGGGVDLARSGGSLPTGGSVDTGGATETGGVVATGGTTKTGGVVATGGNSATGGQATVSSGGSSSTGGAASGGSAAHGGSSATGGQANTGGSGPTVNTSSSGGCALAWGNPPAGHALGMLGLAWVGMGIVRRRRSRR